MSVDSTSKITAPVTTPVAQTAPAAKPEAKKEEAPVAVSGGASQSTPTEVQGKKLNIIA